MKVRLGLFAASPVYYQAPLYRRLAADPQIDFTAIFASDEGARRPLENGYDRPVEWGVDPLEGYHSVFLKKAESNPGGVSTFDLRDSDVIARVWRGRYDVLWLHGYNTVTHVLAAATQKARRAAVFYREDQTLLNPRPWWKTAIKDVGLRWLFHGSYGLFVGTESRLWFERWGMPPERLFHIPYAVDNEALQRSARELGPRREQLRAELGIAQESGPVILTVGRLIEKKEPLFLLEAFRRVRANGRCTLLVVGSGALECDLRQKIAAEGISDVVFTGFLDQTEIGRAYAAADIFALVSSRDETWGAVVNEAMNFGRPIIVSDQVGSGADLVLNGRNGFVVPSGDSEALALALQMLVESAELRQRFGQVSVEVIGHWTYDRSAAALRRAVAAAVGAERWGQAG